MAPRRLRAVMMLAVLAAGVAACNLIAGLSGDFDVAPESDGRDGSRSEDGPSSGGDGPVVVVDGAGGGMDGSPGDAPTGDAPADTFVPDGAVPNLVINANFEQGCSADWAYNGATPTSVTTARSPTKACRVCGVNGGWALYQILQLNTVNGIAAGRRFDSEAWLLKPEAGTESPGHCRIEVYDKDGFSLQFADSPSVMMLSGSVWKACNASLTLSAKSADAGVTIQTVVVGGLGSACFIVDDVSLKLAP